MDFSTPDSLPSDLRQEAITQELVPEQILFNDQDPARYVFALRAGRIRLFFE